MSKPKVGFYWCASCGGCEEAVVDLAEKILEVAAAVDILLWPVALDTKKRDVEQWPEGFLSACFLNGAIRSSEQEEMAQILRRKSQVLIAFGACAQFGGIPGLANLFRRDDLLRAAYLESPSTPNPDGTLPVPEHPHNGAVLHLPLLFESVRTLDQVVDVDYYVPGCPPVPKIIGGAIETLLAGKLPPRGSVLAPDRALCDQCRRKDTRPEDLALKRVRRPHEVEIDPDRCLMAQEILCLGPVTRGGCEALCPQGNMPCTGCFGPTSRVRDFGAKAVSSAASLVAFNDEKEIEAVLTGIPDPLGTFYRYSLPASLLRRKRMEMTHA